MPIGAGHLRSDLDLTASEVAAVLQLAADVKRRPADYRGALAGRIAALMFEKPSLRTRVTFEVGMKQLGGDAILAVGPIGGREPVKDVARNLGRWNNLIVARTFAQKTVDDLASWSGLPVVNALSERWHPCQGLADMQTLIEQWGDVRRKQLTFVGDGNNVAHSLMVLSAHLGIRFVLGCPAGYEAETEIVETARAMGGDVRVFHSPAEALAGADAVYTDVWASMGQESEFQARARVFAPYQVNERLMAMAKPGALFMHCLPAHREEEVVDAVMESAASVVFDQAENRLHAQKALLLMLCGGY